MIRRILTITVLVLLVCSLSDLNAKPPYDNPKTCETMIEAAAGAISLRTRCSAKIVKTDKTHDIFIMVKEFSTEYNFTLRAGAVVWMIAEITKNANWSSDYLYILDSQRLWRIKTSDCRKAARMSEADGPGASGAFVISTFERLF